MSKKKKEDKPVVSRETKKALAEEAVTDKLKKQRHEQDKKAEKPTSDNSIDVSAHNRTLSREDRVAVVEAYKKRNPIKFEMKKERLEKWIKSAN